MNSNIELTTQFQQQFSNFEIFSTVLRGYDLDLQQLDRGSFSANIQQIQSGRVFINHFTATRRLEICGNPPPGLITFGIPTNSCLPFTWRNQYSDGNTIQIYRSNTELEMNTYPFFEAIDVSITEENFNVLMQHWELPSFDEMLHKREMVSCDPVKLQQLKTMLHSICATLENNLDLLKQSPELQDLIKYDIPYLLAQALITSEDNISASTPKKRSYALKTAVEYIKTTPQNTSSLKQFYRETRINERTLQRAFLDRYGISPKSYSQTYHLNNVYKSLIKNNAAKTNIATIASSFGFEHMSQFAKDYHRQFGELPSETLKLDITEYDRKTRHN